MCVEHVEHVTIMAIVLLFVSIIAWVHSASAKTQTLESYKQPICAPDTLCTWAARQVIGVMEQPKVSDHVSIFLPTPRPLTTLQNNMIEGAMDALRNTKDFILFFDREDFRGRVFVLPAMEVSWNQTLRTKEFAKKEIKPHLEGFIDAFKFYYGRKFSCILPPPWQIVLTPFQEGEYPKDPITIKSGRHTNVLYYRGPLVSFTIARSKEENVANI